MKYIRKYSQILKYYKESPIFKSYSTMILTMGTSFNIDGPYIWKENVGKSLC